ncbi:MAG: hypothetical protein G01um101472_196 [Parcubacteria group bacterium Gr01-1014_72]|nr:MAG: hypothetical protein G01um101472_196 [Parcubacteria group bacterium Gr01-1014_72]
MEEKDSSQNGLPWHIVEKAIAKEYAWLKKVLDFGPRFKEQDEIASELGIENYQMLRQIGIAIVSGKISARDIITEKASGLWSSQEMLAEIHSERHGGEWHKAMMGVIKKHFEEGYFEVVNEPYLNFGRADLGVYKPDYPNLYVEVGTTSLFKFWRNLSSMPHSVFLFVPTEYGAIEFITKNQDGKAI